MVERSTSTEGLQIGVESTAGTAVAANKKMRTFDAIPRVNTGSQIHRSPGLTLPTRVVPGKEHLDWNLQGIANYGEITYLLASLFNTPSPTQQGATSAYEWVFTEDIDAIDTSHKTFTIEKGQSARAYEAPFFVVTELGVAYTRDGVALTGSAVSQELTDGITMTASPSYVDDEPVVPDHVSVYLDTTSGGLGTTKLTKVLAASINIANGWNPYYALNNAEPSFAGISKGGLVGTVSLDLIADSTAMGFLTDWQNATRKFLRLACDHDDANGIDTSETYQLYFDCAVDVEDFRSIDDNDGLTAVSVQLQIMADTTWGKGVEVNVHNALTTL